MKFTKGKETHQKGMYEVIHNGSVLTKCVFIGDEIQLYTPDINPDFTPLTPDQIIRIFYHPVFQSVNFNSVHIEKMRPDGKHYFFRATFKPS